MMDTLAMKSTVASLLAPGKGLLAADESIATISKRFEALGIVSTEDSRSSYRRLLFTTPALSDHISGAILFDETIRQKVRDALIPNALAQSGIVPGIKVDKGTVSLARFPGERVTQGLDSLGGRLAEYCQLGARFTKWRAVIAVGDGLPTPACIEANAHALSMFAALSQEAGLVPIVEPEVLMDGNHTLERCEEVMSAVLNTVFARLFEYRVELETMLLKTGMALPGKECPQQSDIGEMARATIRCLRRAVPAAVPGIVFLSGGQSCVAATKRLNEICSVGGVPWTLSFSFGRGLQDTALDVWKGSPANVTAAQDALRHRAACNGLAVRGMYSDRAELNGDELKGLS